jgi:phosphate transport system substrate-binding protein
VERIGVIRPASLAAITALVIAAVSACGSDDNFGSAAIRNTTDRAGTVSCGGKRALTAEGSTAQQNAIGLFSQVWAQACPGKIVSYNPTGSGAGREQFIAGHVDFAGSDSPLISDQIGPAARRCNGNPAWDLPMVMGPVALVYNLPGVPKLVVNSDVLAKIFSGAVTRWSDPILVALNPDVVLPDTRVAPIYRADSSGTTDNLQRYLTADAPQSWSRGIGTEFLGGVGQGVQKSAGVIHAVQTTPGAIGYTEKGLADQAGMSYAQIDTGSGGVPLTAETARNAVNTVGFVASGNDLVLDLNRVYTTRVQAAYPLVLATYEVVCSNGYDEATSTAVKSFLSMAAGSGQAGLSAAGYIPLPDKVKERLASAINAMQ